LGFQPYHPDMIAGDSSDGSDQATDDGSVDPVDDDSDSDASSPIDTDHLIPPVLETPESDLS